MTETPQAEPPQPVVKSKVKNDCRSVPPGSVQRVVVAVGVALLATTCVLGIILVLVARAEWWRGLLAAGMVMVLAGLLSLPPLIWGLQRQLMHAVTGYFMAAGVRLIVALGGCLLAVMVGGYPAAPTLLLMVVYYLAILAAESAMVAKALWKLQA